MPYWRVRIVQNSWINPYTQILVWCCYKLLTCHILCPTFWIVYIHHASIWFHFLFIFFLAYYHNLILMSLYTKICVCLCWLLAGKVQKKVSTELLCLYSIVVQGGSLRIVQCRNVGIGSTFKWQIQIPQAILYSFTYWYDISFAQHLESSSGISSYVVNISFSFLKKFFILRCYNI